MRSLAFRREYRTGVGAYRAEARGNLESSVRESGHDVNAMATDDDSVHPLNHIADPIMTVAPTSTDKASSLRRDVSHKLGRYSNDDSQIVLSSLDPLDRFDDISIGI
jgi:hypothetical protein